MVAAEMPAVVGVVTAADAVLLRSALASADEDALRCCCGKVGAAVVVILGPCNVITDDA